MRVAQPVVLDNQEQGVLEQIARVSPSRKALTRACGNRRLHAAGPSAP